MKKAFVNLILLTIVSKVSLSQCLPDSILKTDSLGTNIEKLAFDLTFRIGKDSIWVRNSANLTKEFISFAIQENPECNWNSDYTKGYSSYKLKLTDRGNIKYPTLRIIYEKEFGNRIEILYPNSNEQIFTLVK